MKVLVIGSGGREHALAWKVKQSPLCEELFVAPGNAGTVELGVNVPIKPENFEALKEFVVKNAIDLVIVGPEDPLVAGISDFFWSNEELKQVPVLGPGGEGAQLEASKEFAKRFMQKYNIPTATYRSFVKAEAEEARKYIHGHSLPIVMKADGLAAGKGVSICFTREEALLFLNDVWDKQRFGAAGDKIVVEQFLDGIELSVFILTDGERYILLPEAKDYKKVGEGDTGPNTGGMGAISPVPFSNEAFMRKIKEQVIEPTVNGLKAEKINYRGFIFFGLINVKGEPYVIEYNVRMGDPETEVVMPRIASDLLPLMLQAAKGKLESTHIEFDERWAATVIAVSGGYPGSYAVGHEINGLAEIDRNETYIFHAGTKAEKDTVFTAGGRVLAATSLAGSLEEAVELSYKNIFRIHFSNMYYRKDIGKEFMALLK